MTQGIYSILTCRVRISDKYHRGRLFVLPHASHLRRRWRGTRDEQKCDQQPGPAGWQKKDCGCSRLLHRSHLLEREEMDEVGQVQTFYRQSAASFARYWLDYITQEKEDADLDGEIDNIFSAFSLAAACDLHDVLVQGVEGIHAYCEARGMYNRIQAELDRACPAAAALGDRAALARNALLRGRVAMRQERFSDAEQDWSKGLALAETLGDPQLICAFETEFGVMAIERRQYSRAEEHLQRALQRALRLEQNEQIAVLLGELCRTAYFQRHLEQAEAYARQGLEITTAHHLPHRTTGLLSYLGIIEESRGNLAEARRHWEEGLILARQVGVLARISNLLVNLGMLANQTGDWQAAAGYLAEGLEIARRLGQSREISHLLTDLGIVHAAQGEQAQAEAALHESLELARQLDHRPLLTRNLLTQGEFFLGQEDWSRAETCFVECTELQHSANDRDREKAASAFWGLARIAQAQGNQAAAEEAGQRSLALFHAIGHHRAEQVRAWLAGLAGEKVE